MKIMQNDFDTYCICYNFQTPTFSRTKNKILMKNN